LIDGDEAMNRELLISTSKVLFFRQHAEAGSKELSYKTGHDVLSFKKYVVILNGLLITSDGLTTTWF
jgi:hypothetical protein